MAANLQGNGFCDGDTLALGNIYDFTIEEGEQVEVGTYSVYEHDSSSSNDPFSNFIEPFSYTAVISETKVLRISGDDGVLDTTIRIEVIQGVPAQSYPPVGGP